MTVAASAGDEVRAVLLAAAGRSADQVMTNRASYLNIRLREMAQHPTLKATKLANTIALLGCQSVPDAMPTLLAIERRLWPQCPNL